ncbi:putative transposase [Ralstonia solanacearum]|nr:putative transposase [Ralstonia solanacearum]
MPAARPERGPYNDYTMNLTQTQTEHLASNGVHVLDTKRTAYGTRHYIRTDDGRQMWTYDVMKFAERKADAWREQRAKEIEATHVQEVLDTGLTFLTKADLARDIRRRVQAGETSIRAAARQYRIPESTLRRLLQTV